MQAQELIDLLKELDPKTEIRYMAQPSWPFEYSLRGHLYHPEHDPDLCREFVLDTSYPADEQVPDVCAHCGCNRDEHNAEPGFTPTDVDGPVAYLVEGRQLAYGTKDAWN